MEESKRIVDFRSIELKGLDGGTDCIDISKIFGNLIYKTTADLGAFEAARIIYKDGQIEITKEIKQGLIEILIDPRCPFTILLKTKLIELIEGKEQ